MNPLHVRPKHSANYNAVTLPEASLDHQLARVLLAVPSLSKHLSKSDLNAVGSASRSCYHAASRSHVWRDTFEPKLRRVMAGPVPSTPSHLTERDMHIALMVSAFRKSSLRATLLESTAMSYHASSLLQPETRGLKLRTLRVMENIEIEQQINAQQPVGFRYFLTYLAPLAALKRTFAVLLAYANRNRIWTLMFLLTNVCLLKLGIRDFFSLSARRSG